RDSVPVARGARPPARARPGEGLVQPDVARCHLAIIEASARPAPGPLPEIVVQPVVAPELVERLRQRDRVTGPEVECIGAPQLPERADVGQNEAASGHGGLHGCETERLVEGGPDIDIGPPEELAHARAGEPPEVLEPPRFQALSLRSLDVTGQ